MQPTELAQRRPAKDAVNKSSVVPMNRLGVQGDQSEWTGNAARVATPFLCELRVGCEFFATRRENEPRST